MTAATEPPPRIVTLDIVRGVAVMGILAMNVVGFALPFQAYLNPLALGPVGEADFASWVVGFIFIDGKMRGLFSFLFGASMLLVIEQAKAKGEAEERIHYRRMFWLLAFGLVHLYLVWFGDILAGYALVGMIAFLFRDLPRRALVAWAIGLLAVQLLVFAGLAATAAALQQQAAAPGAEPAIIAEWEGLQRLFGAMSPQARAQELALYRGGYGAILADRLRDQAIAPVKGLGLFGWETLAYFLLGMAGLKSGFLTGGWSAGRYRRTALAGFAVGIPAYAGLAWLLARDGFSVPTLIALSMAATVPLRPVMVVATAALIILATREGGALVERIAAAGRAAFTNYLGTSLLMTSLFYGYGGALYGRMGRAELWLVVVAMWGLMLLWSKPWLERFRYGPLEWLWRSLARGALQPMRRTKRGTVPIYRDA
ncbi:MAG TPA: DUF418 domain-containing protein [Allosphingosinicella sp.]|jgi:uncharacterized protein|nr:DUF418 domain-containing protein [Allosphingosinicella sp.]